MSRLYIANCTRQNQEIYYRLDFTEHGDRERDFRPATKQALAPGKQDVIGKKDLHVSQVESIVSQLSRHGLIGMVDVPRHTGKVPYVFNIDAPVPARVIRSVMNANEGILAQEGKLRRARAAVASNELITNAVANEFAAKGLDRAATQDVDVEFEQEDQSEAGERRLEEGIRVRADAPAASSKTFGSGKKRKK